MGRLLGTDKETERLIRAARRDGWEVSITGSGHIRFRSPDPGVPLIFGSLTTSTHGARALRRDLAKAGLEVAR